MPGDDPDGGRAGLLRNPPVRVPTGTSLRFAVLVVTILASTGSIFGYLWQLAAPSVQDRVHQCVSAGPLGPLANFIQRVRRSGAATSHVAGCVRSTTPTLVTWVVLGIGALVVVSLLCYAILPWWLIYVGWPGNWRGLSRLDVGKHPELAAYLDDLVTEVTPECRPVFLVNRRPGPVARVFGHQRRAFVQLDLVLLPRFETDLGLFTTIVLHELAHVRNRDNRASYLTLAAMRTFAVLVPTGYVVAALMSGTLLSMPDPRTLAAVLAMVALVWLSARSVLRVREFHADATAASFNPGSLPGPDLAAKTRRSMGAFREKIRYHPDWISRVDALARPQTLYCPETLTMFSAGVAVGLVVSELTLVLFAASLSWWFSSASMLNLNSGVHALVLLLAIYVPVCLLIAVLISSLAVAATWRLHFRFRVDGTRVPVARLAIPMAAGILLGEPLSVSNAVSGSWGVLDTDVARDLLVALLSAGLLAITLTALFRWATESAAAWFGDSPRFPKASYVASMVLGSLALTPVLCAWDITHDQALNVQLTWEPYHLERELASGWPAMQAVFAQYLPLSAFDVIPGNVLLLALPCAFVAAGALRRTPSGEVPLILAGHAAVPLRAVLARGLTGAVFSVVIVAELMVSLRWSVGDHAFSRTGELGLMYLTRDAEAVIAVCAGATALWAASTTRQTRLTTGVLAGLIAFASSALVCPYLLDYGMIGWSGKLPKASVVRVLYGLVGTLGAGRAIVGILAFLGIGGVVSRLLPGVRGSGDDMVLSAGSGPVAPDVRVRAGAALVLVLLAMLAAVAYCYLAADFSY